MLLCNYHCTVFFLSAADLHSDDNDEEKLKFNRLIKKGKELGRQGQLERALQLFEKAYSIFESGKLLRRIEKIKVKFNIVNDFFVKLPCFSLSYQ